MRWRRLFLEQAEGGGRGLLFFEKNKINKKGKPVVVINVISNTYTMFSLFLFRFDLT